MREGNLKFQAAVRGAYRELFETLSSGQQPTTLLIACADSRVVPSLFTGTKPGELFVERNPGALVPVYSNAAVGVSASIEYAVSVLKVKYIAVCGHSDCGAMSAALHPEKTKGVPAVARWLSYAAPAVARMTERERALSGEKQRTILTKHCVRVQMEHLLTHPSVRQAIEERNLRLLGVYYDIATGKLTRLRQAWSAAQPTK